MTRRRCPVMQSSIARAIRAAKQEGARSVMIDPDGKIWIDPSAGQGENPQLAKERAAAERESVF